MKLIYSPTSPFARKVRVFARELGVAITLVQTNPFDSDEVLLKANPLSKVPALVTEEGTQLDSAVICEYLNTHYARDGDSGTSLYPPAAARWHALRRQVLADGLMGATLLRRLEMLRPAAQQSNANITRQAAVVRRTLVALEADPLGNGVDIGTIALGCALGYLDHRFAQEPWRANHPKLSDWYATFSKRPAMLATAPPVGS